VHLSTFDSACAIRHAINIAFERCFNLADDVVVHLASRIAAQGGKGDLADRNSMKRCEAAWCSQTFHENPIGWHGSPNPDDRRIILDRIKAAVSKKLTRFCAQYGRYPLAGPAGEACSGQQM
jgi:hypothetical protein